jgi:transcription-repair coupling factor (superfamily II helicase)
MSENLYTVKDVQRVREFLIEEQSNIDALTELEILPKQAVLDHSHDTQYVRAVISRQANAFLGKLENNFVRYLRHWYPETLSTFLRKAANYLEKPDDQRWVHPGWIKKVTAGFNKLPEAQKDVVLLNLGYEKGKNSTERKATFKTLTLDRSLGYEKVISEITKAALRA